MGATVGLLQTRSIDILVVASRVTDPIRALIPGVSGVNSPVTVTTAMQPKLTGVHGAASAASRYATTTSVSARLSPMPDATAQPVGHAVGRVVSQVGVPLVDWLT